jgi:hypothetical protein
MDRAKLEDESLLVFKLSVAFYFYFNFYIFKSYCKKVVTCFVKRATFLQIYLEVMVYPRTTTWEGNQRLLPKGSEGIANIVTNMYYLQKLSKSSEEFFRGEDNTI